MLYGVNKNSSIPIYQQVKKLLLDQIRNNAFVSRKRIPSENQICKIYNVSRVTVRQAISSLVNDGLLFTVPGKGTFLNGIMQETRLEYIESFQSKARKRGFTAHIKVIEERVEKADSAIAGHLRIKEGEKVIRIKRVKTANYVPLFTELRFIPLKFCPDLIEKHLTGKSLTELARNRYYLKIQSRDITVTPIILDSKSAMLLKANEETPGLMVAETLFLSGDVPFKWEQRIHKSGLHFTTRAVIK